MGVFRDLDLGRFALRVQDRPECHTVVRVIARLIDRLTLWSAYRSIVLMQKYRGVGRGDVRFQQEVIDRWDSRSPLFGPRG